MKKEIKKENKERAIKIVNALKGTHFFLVGRIATKYSLTYCICYKRWVVFGEFNETGCCESCEICKDK